MTMETMGMAKGQLVCRRVGSIFVGIVLMLTGAIGLLVPVVPGIFLLAAGAYFLSPGYYSQIHRKLKQCGERFARLSGQRSFSDKTSINAAADDPPSAQRQPGQHPRPRCEPTEDSHDSETVVPKILIFDVDPRDLAWHSEPFEALRYEVHKCASIDAAMRCIEREEFDYALVDQVSPAFEGLRIIRHLMRYNLLTPFVVTSRSVDPRCQQEALALGAAGYLLKPVSREDLNRIVQNCPTVR
jgi:CheY-like chemotaxis protein